MAAAVPLALAVLEAAVPLADLESDFEFDTVVLDVASDVLVEEALEDVEDVSACNLSPQLYYSSLAGPSKHLPLCESSCLRRIKLSRSLYDGGHGQAEVMEVRRKSVKRIWLSRNRWNMTSEELKE